MTRNMIGRFVTAYLIDPANPEDRVRQGVVIAESSSQLVIRGVSGLRYEVYPDATVVPDSNLFGREKEMVLQFRKSRKERA